MKITKTTTAELIVEQALENIKNSFAHDGAGERRSDYLVFLRDEANNSVSIDITEKLNGLKEKNRRYLVHLVDGISPDRYSEFFITESFTKESLLATVSKIIKTTLENLTAKSDVELCEKLKEEIELSQEQLERNDDIYNAAYQFILILLEKNEDNFPWDMMYIGNVIEAVSYTLNELGHRIRWASVVTENDDTQYIEEYYEPLANL